MGKFFAEFEGLGFGTRLLRKPPLRLVSRVEASWTFKRFWEEPQHQAALRLPALGEHLFTEVVYLPEASCPESETSWLKAICGARTAAPQDAKLSLSGIGKANGVCLFLKTCQGGVPPVG